MEGDRVGYLIISMSYGRVQKRKRNRGRISKLSDKGVVADRRAVEARRSSRFKPAQGKAKFGQSFRQAYGRRVALPSGAFPRFPYVNYS